MSEEFDVKQPADPVELRGSRKHVLDWVEQPRFLEELQALVAPVPCLIPAGSAYLPLGHANRVEARLDSFGRRAFPESPVWDELRRWWLRHPKGANTPNWDLAVVCEIAGKRGLLLVEAKANVPELSNAGKAKYRASSTKGVENRQRSRENHAQIVSALESARLALEPMLPGIRISAEHHYQLSNRLAFAWKLASFGIPTVLLYLGFTGDLGMSRRLVDESHWQSVLRCHLNSLCESGIPEAPISACAAEFWVLGRAKEVLQSSRRLGE